MKLLSNVRKTILSGAIATVLFGISSGTLQAKTEVNDLTNELEIMSNIMRTSLKQSSKDSSYKIHALDVTYLKKQGVVFEVKTSSGEQHFIFEFSDGQDFIMAPPVPPMPPGSGEDFEYEIEYSNKEWEDGVESMVEHAHHSMEEARQKLRELRKQEHDYAWQLRDTQRKLRDIEFELRGADKARSDELRSEQKQLEKDVAKLKVQQAEAEKSTQKLQQQREQKEAEKREKQQQQNAAFLAQFESNISTTLCKYGNGLAALSDDEYVSFILPDFINKALATAQDRIYVFRNQDIQSCVKNKMSAKQLLAKADSYNF